MRAIVGLFSFVLTTSAAAQLSGNAPVRVWQDTLTLPTYEEGPPDINPPFDQFVANGRYNYPYTMRENLSVHASPHPWRALNL